MTQENNKNAASDGKPPQEGERKERVLHTRIPVVLERELKQLALNLRVPVSNLVRAILQDALEAAETMGRVAEEELRGAANRLAAERERLGQGAAAQGVKLRAQASPGPEDQATDESPVLAGVIGYQEFLLAVETRCSRCDRKLTVGEPAYLGVRDTPGPRIIIGPECLPGKKETE